MHVLSVITSSSAVIALLKMKDQSPARDLPRPRLLRLALHTASGADNLPLEPVSSSRLEEPEDTGKGGYEFTSHINVSSYVLGSPRPSPILRHN